MKHNWKRLLSIVLTLALVFSLLVPVAAAKENRAKDGRLQALELTPVDAGTLGLLQESLLPEEAALEAEPYRLTDAVRVSIVLERASTVDAGYPLEGIADNAAARAYRDGLKAEQAEMTARIEAALGGTLDVKRNLTLAANIISANVRYGDLAAIRAVPGVASVEIEQRYELNQAQRGGDAPNMGTSTVQIGSGTAWASGYTGAGSRVAIIDTGADVDHQSFSGAGLEYALAESGADVTLMTAADIDAVADQLNAPATGAEAYISAKIPYGYNYVDGNYDVTHENDTQGNHGSHVSGIAAANRFVQVDGEWKTALSEVGVQGVAPDAQLIEMKVFGKGGGAYDSDYMAAIEDAIILGCDSANLSLGSGNGGMAFSGTYESVMNKLVENGMVVAFSAGNSYSWYDTPYNDAMYGYLYTDDVNYDTVGSPGSFTNSLTVASVDNSGLTGMPLMFGELPVFYTEKSDYGNAPIATLAALGTLEYVLVDGPGVTPLTTEDDDSGKTAIGVSGYDVFSDLGSEILSGKIAICKRGSSSFFVKANAAIAQGAIGVIIFNNRAGTISMDLSGYQYSAPVVSITQADGEAIMAQSAYVDGDQPYYTGSLTVSDALQLLPGEETDVQTISDFSSWGVPGSLTMKPEIAAPGGSIYSVQGHHFEGGVENGSHETYELMSGTSMASPQVAGMAAVMGQYIRENGLEAKTGLTARQLTNSLLMSTAVPMFTDGGDYWPILQQGAGLANVGKAVSAQSYILMAEDATMFPDSARDGKVKAELGDDPARSGSYSYSFTVYPLSEAGTRFHFRTDIFTQWIAGNGGYGLLQDTGTVLLGSDVRYEVNGETYSDYFTLDADVNGDGETDEADAQAILDKLSGALAEDAAFDAAVADVDGDGTVTTVDARLILASAATQYVDITAPTEVTVNIQVDPDDVAFLNNYFTGGFYIEGYTYLEPDASDEGEILDVSHAIPILGFCGAWTDASMFDRTSPIGEAYGIGKLPYLANSKTNYLSIRSADGTTRTFMGNPYTVEERFPADRLAVNGNDTLYQVNYLPIRNIGSSAAAVLDAEGKVLWLGSVGGTRYAPYYYVNGGAWQNYSPASASINKTLGSLGLKSGDQATVGFYALPEYYAIQYAKENGSVAASGALDAEGFRAVLESGTLGEGAGIDFTVTVDNDAPVVKSASRDLITGSYSVQAQDDQYIAFVGFMNRSGSKVYASAVPEQTEPGQAVEVVLDLEGQTMPANVLLVVGDYAGNQVAFKVNVGGSQEALGGLMLGFTSNNAGAGSGNRWLELDPETLYYNKPDVYDGMSVYSAAGTEVRAAAYADGYVFMAGTDGYFYVSDIGDLERADRVGKYADVSATVYDMAYDRKTGVLYALGEDNTLYAVDRLTGAMTAVAILTLNEGSGVANKLTVDDGSTFYVASSGGPSSSRLYSFRLTGKPAIDLNAAESWDFETDPGEAGWVFTDSDGDGNNWIWTPDSSFSNFECYEGTGMLVSASYVNGYGALTPDNWATTPAFDLSEADAASLSFMAKGQDASWPAEVFKVYAGTDPENLSPLTEDLTATGDWTRYSADLSDYAGESAVYAAIRHYNVTDMYMLDVDMVQVNIKKADTPAPTYEKITVDPIGLMGVWNYGEGGALAWDYNSNILYLAANYDENPDTDHVLWVLDTETGKGTRVNASNGNFSGRFYVCLNGLFIVPGSGEEITPAEKATGLEVTPDALNLLRGMTAQLTAAVYPWTLEDKSVSFVSADESIATVTADGAVTGVTAGSTSITVTTAALPQLSVDVPVTVEEAPVAQLRGVIWDDSGKGQASVFDTDKTRDWTAVAEVGQFRWGALVDDQVYGSTEDTLYIFDADTYEVSELGSIVSDWIPSDAVGIPEEMALAWELDPSFCVGGICNNGLYFEVLDPEAGSLVYFDLSYTFDADPMAVIADTGIVDDYVDSYNAETHPDSRFYYMMTESGTLWRVALTMDGGFYPEEIGPTGLNLEGVADVTNQVWASLVYDAASGFLYLSHYDGSADVAQLYAIDPTEPTRNALLGDFNDEVWPVTGLHQYEPATDLVLRVNTGELSLFKTKTAQVKIKVKLGDTNAFTVSSSDPSVAVMDETGLVTAVGEGTATLTVTTVDRNDLGEQLSKSIAVTVKPLTTLDAALPAQISPDAETDLFAVLDLNDLSYSALTEAPYPVFSGALTGDIYMAGSDSEIVALDAADLSTEVAYPFDTEHYPEYPAMDIANYPMFVDADGEPDTHKALFTTSVGFLATPDYYGWDLSSYLPDMAAIAFAGVDASDADEDGEDDTFLYVYFVLTASGTLCELDINYVNGYIDGLYELLDTGIRPAAQSDLSMAWIQADDLSYAGLVVADAGSREIWYVDFLTEDPDSVVGLCGTLDVANVSGLVGTLDGIVGDATLPFDPYAEGEKVWSEGFETDPAENGWTFVDSDGDGYNWIWNTSEAIGVYEGSGCIYSQSYDKSSSSALEPDNWAISPAIDLSAVSGSVFSVFAKGQDESWCDEVFRLYAGTSPDPAEMTALTEDITATGKYRRYTADLSAFEGQSEVYLAIRHYNVSDMFYLNIDLAEVIVPAEEPTDAAQPVRALRIAPAARSVGDGAARMDRAPLSFSGPVQAERLLERSQEVRGSLNAIRGSQAARPQYAELGTPAEDDAPETMAVELSETEATRNGLLTATYDPEVLTFVSGDSALDYCSVHDDGAGTVTFTYAAVDEIAAGEVLATLKFAYTYDEDAGTRASVTVATAERDDDTAVSEEPTVVELGLYSQPVWSWEPVEEGEEDAVPYTATATFKIPGEEDSVLEAAVALDEETSVAATCEAAGQNVYAASVTGPDGETYTDTRTDPLDPLGHAWGFAEEDGVVWAEDYSSVSVHMVCANDPSHSLSGSTDAITVTYDPAPTCTEDGYVSYDAVVDLDGMPVSVGIGLTAPATGHSYGAPVWTWSDDCSMAVAAFTCTEGDDTVELSSAVAADAEASAAPSCEAAGQAVYVASVTGPDGETWTDTKTVTLPATGHAWGEPEWTWEADYSAAKAKFTCANDASHVQDLDATVSPATTDPDCTTDGQTVYTATVTGPDGKQYSDEKTVTLPATGHSYSAPVWTWAEDCSMAVATFTCTEGDDSVKLTATVAADAAASAPASCEAAGQAVYVASVTGPDGETYTDTKTVTLPATGHAWGEPEWTWATGYKTATLKLVCGNDPAHVVEEELEAEITRSGMTTTYTVRYELDGETYSDSRSVTRRYIQPAPTPTPTPTPEPKLFDDAQNENDWFFDAVYWAVEKDVAGPETEEHFGVASDYTRAQTVLALWKAVGAPEPATAENPFEDVSETDVFYKAVLWGSETGVIKGVDVTHFAPDLTVTRGQAVTFLYRAAKGSVPTDAENPFEDVTADDYYYEPILWAVSLGVTEGVDATHFAPQSTLTAGHIVTFLYRLYKEA
ncbi:MAG: S8 family serine peptidase [Oscillospiraceae bacterium]|nr:S8 family serine peptidase [Oscillospiraceae bacterium]